MEQFGGWVAAVILAGIAVIALYRWRQKARLNSRDRLRDEEQVNRLIQGAPDQFLIARHIGSTAKRVLVVDDEAELASLISLLLQQQGYRVDIAPTGGDAMQALQSSHFDAVTLDLHLPDFSGLEVIRRIRASPNLVNMPIIVLSSKFEAGKLMYKGDESAIEWLAKPIDQQQLVVCLKRQLRTSEI